MFIDAWIQKVLSTERFTAGRNERLLSVARQNYLNYVDCARRNYDFKPFESAYEIWVLIALTG